MTDDLNEKSSLKQDEFILNLDEGSIEEPDFIISTIKKTFEELKDSTTKSLVIQRANMTEDQARLILDHLNEPDLAVFAVKITLPEPLANTRIQIELDNLISNHILENNKRSLGEAPILKEQSGAPTKKGVPQGRTIPKKVKPKIEITLHEGAEVEYSSGLETPTVKPLTVLSEAFVAPKLERAPMAAAIIDTLLKLERYKAQKEIWDELTERSKAEAFRKDFPHPPGTSIEDHPLHDLIGDNQALHDELVKWTNTLNLDLGRYDALLDVVGQYGTEGLERLFQTWNYSDDERTSSAFKDTHALLLKEMPSYLPFIQGNDVNEAVKNIGLLTETKRSWWNALIKNHLESVTGYSDLPYLYKVFTEATVAIENMSLPFNKIEAIKEKKDLPTTLFNMISLLNKCPEQDRKVQLSCINTVDIAEHAEVHFIIPEMKLGEPQQDLEAIKAAIASKDNSNPDLFKPGFYRFLAKQKKHLPLEQYESILKEISSNKELTNQNKLGLIYVLAKSTSSDKEAGFDNQTVYDEWMSFQNRTIQLEYMERIIANRDYFAKIAFKGGIENEGGYTAVRDQILKQIIEMKATPPMSYLNKLLKLSEYKFLDPDLSILAMKSRQSDMTTKIVEAAELYAVAPDIMEQAIRFIKTQTVAVNAQGTYFPDRKDISLLEQFVSASTTLMDTNHNNLNNPDHNPSQVLLPLLTTFHLEYASKEQLNNAIIDYKQRSLKNETLLPYGLSLLQKIKDRKKPKELDIVALDTIQKGLVTLSSKKQIREWLHQNYGAYFDGNVLLDIKDEVNFKELFEQHEVTDPKIIQSIERLVSTFDEELEKEYHKALAETLVELSKKLTPVQNTRFFEYCNDALKTEGIFSRDKKDSPPTYIQQFITLVKTISEERAIAELGQYLIIAKEHKLRSGDSPNNLIKCNYMIKSLFPFLKEKGIEPKEAFNFGAHMVCQSPVEALTISHEQVNYRDKIEFSSRELNNLKEQIASFYTNDKSTADLLQVRNAINDVLALAPNDNNYFKLCRTIVGLIDSIDQDIIKRTEEQKNKSLWEKARSVVWNLGFYNPTISDLELKCLKDAGIFELAADTEVDVKNLKLKMNTRFQDLVAHLHKKKESLIKKYENIAPRASDFITKALSLSLDDRVKNHDDTSQLIDELIALDDQNLVLSLMYHFAGGLNDRGANDLVCLVNAKNYQSLNSATKKEFINAIVSQMNNSVTCGKAEYTKFLGFICQNKDNQFVMDKLRAFYQQAPYPPLKTFMDWIQKPLTSKELNNAYQKFDKNPCAIDGHDGREKENGFKLKEARNIIRKMPEVQHICTERYILNMEHAAEQANKCSTEALLTYLKDYKNIPHDDHIKLVMFATELLHRSKGRTPDFVGKEQVPGRSFELNTTQLMAVLAMLETGEKVTAEIGTGEGKTRIMMLLNACQFLKGNTVDFLTSNLALAERDYLESLPFFKSLGAEVNFITASSKIEDYKMNGINFSDPANLSLFRLKARKQNRLDEVLNPEATKRALDLDEADVTFYDVAHTKYNLSSEADENDIALIPLYSVLMEFFAQGDIEKTYLEDKKLCTDRLKQFIQDRKLDDLYERITQAGVAQLEKWQDAAYTARHLEFNVDYTIVSEATIPTQLGNKQVAAARCLIGGRIDEHAKFADGVHACLHAELNRLMNTSTNNLYLNKMLEKCKTKDRRFPIEPQRRVDSSTSSSSMLKDYGKGTMMAITGTAGTYLEKREAKEHVKTKFIEVPRHKGMRRYDKPIVICDTDQEYVDTFVSSILQAQSKNEPTLILCENDTKSQELYDAINRRLSSLKHNKKKPKITRIHAATDSEDSISEADYIKNHAGNPGQVTISTEMLGRGVDIKPGAAGLRVLHAYLPKEERDYIQGVGRSGRFGQIGNTQMILDIESLKRDFGIDHLNTDFYLNPDAFIRRLQIFSSITKKLNRLFCNSFEDLLDDYAQRYELHRTENKVQEAAWSEFKKQLMLSQQDALGVIEAQIQDAEPKIEQIEDALNKHRNNATDLWNTFFDTLDESQKAEIDNNPPELKKPKELTGWIDTMKDLQAKNTYKVEVLEKRKVKVHDVYNEANQGRAHVLKNPGPFYVNFQNWWNGEGELFPNLRAWWRGEMDFTHLLLGTSSKLKDWKEPKGLLFANERAWLSGNMSFRNMISQWPIFRYFISPIEEVHQVKIKIPSTYAYFYKEHQELMEPDEEDLSSEAGEIEPYHHVVKDKKEEKDEPVNGPPSPNGQ